MTRKKLKLADLLAQCDAAAPFAGNVWPNAAPVGREFGSPDRERREDAVKAAIASIELEGFSISDEEKAHAQRFIDGEITVSEFVHGLPHDGLQR